MPKHFYIVQDTEGTRSGFYLAKSIPDLQKALCRKDGRGTCAEDRLFTALRYRIEKAKVKKLGAR